MRNSLSLYMNRFLIGLCLLLSVARVPVKGQTYDEWCGHASSAIEADSLAQAEEYIRQALKLEPVNPHNALLFSNMGTIQRRQGKQELAVESYSFALNFAPASVPILMNRATLYMEMGQEEKARVDYALVLDYEKDNKEALLMRAFIYMNQRNYPFARADYERLLKLEPQHYQAWLGLAILEQKEKKYQAALEQLNAMLAAREGSDGPLTDEQVAVLYVARADVEQEMGHTELALADLEEAIALDAAQREAYLMRGQLYLQQKKKVQAKRDLEQAVALGVPQAEVRELLKQCK